MKLNVLYGNTIGDFSARTVFAQNTAQEKNYTKISFHFRRDVGQRGEMGLFGEQIRQKVFSLPMDGCIMRPWHKGVQKLQRGSRAPCAFSENDALSV
jgi:hypothetical protein